MILEVPNIFLVDDCKKCRYRHAPIRDCVDPEGNKLYFDAVLLKGTRVILFNGTPDETVAYLRGLDKTDQETLVVIEGLTLITKSVEEYLSN